MTPENTQLPRSWLSGSEKLSNALLRVAEHRSTEVINMSAANHATITLALHRATYHLQAVESFVPLVFLDGSKPSPFPLGGLGAAAASNPAKTQLRIGLMSFRHPEMDYLVDCYVTRNRELALLSTMAEEEELAHSRALQLLQDVSDKTECDLLVYHTGLEPMVVGFYRAVVEVLRERRRRGEPRTFQVCPHFFATKPTRSNLSPASPGAQHTNYLPGPRWA